MRTMPRTPEELFSTVRRDERDEIARQPLCDCPVRVGVRALFHPDGDFYIYRCQVCRCLVPAQDVDEGRAFVRPEVFN